MEAARGLCLVGMRLVVMLVLVGIHGRGELSRRGLFSKVRGALLGRSWLPILGPRYSSCCTHGPSEDGEAWSSGGSCVGTWA